MSASDHFPSALIPKVLFEDQHLMVLDKPAGLLSQGDVSGEPNLVDWLRERLGRPYVGLVHRLDRNTSGLMVVAKRTKSANRLTAALQKGDLQRAYLAWVHGTLAAPARWAHVLEKEERTNTVRVVRGRPGKQAVLSARPVRPGQWRGETVTLVEFVLETGRSHQIRVQAAAEGHALVGDRKYARVDDGFPRPALHSYRLSFPHPMSGETMTYESELPEDLRKISAPNP